MKSALLNRAEAWKLLLKNKLFSTDELEQWKDDIAGYHREEVQRAGVKKVIEALQRWWRLTKKEAVELELLSRENNQLFVELYLTRILHEFHLKLEDKAIKEVSVRLSFEPGATAEVYFKGSTYYHDVDGHVALVGQVWYTDGTRTTIFQKFISHPFWQYQHRIS